MANDFEIAKSQLQKLIIWAAEHNELLRRNEADTREKPAFLAY